MSCGFSHCCFLRESQTGIQEDKNLLTMKVEP